MIQPELSPLPELPPTTAPVAGFRRRLCPLVMIGDPDLETTRQILDHCIGLGIEMVELCLPFPRAFTDGPTLQRAHARGLATGAGLEDALALIAEYGARIEIFLLVDSSHTLRPAGMEALCLAAAKAGAAGILPHGLPPRLAPEFEAATKTAGLAVVGTLYAGGGEVPRRATAERASAFIYLVSAYGRSGGAAPVQDLSAEIAALRPLTARPIALGFGLKTPEDIARAFAQGCDIAIVGSAISDAVERGLGTPDPLGLVRALLAALAEGLRHDL